MNSKNRRRNIICRLFLILIIFGVFIFKNTADALTINNDAQVTNTQSVTLDFTVPSNCAYVYAQNENSSPVSIGCTSPQQWSLSSGDGQKTVWLQIFYTYQVPCGSYCCAKDWLGRCTSWCTSYCTTCCEGYGESDSIILNTHPPETIMVARPNEYMASTNASFSFYADEPVKRFDCLLYSDTLQQYDYNCGTYNSTFVQYFWNYSGLADGTYTFNVTAIDLADYLDLTPATFTWTVDTQPPVDGIFTVNVNNKDVYLNWSGFSDATSGIYLFRLAVSVSAYPDSCSSGAVMYEGQGTSYVHTNLSNGTYYYRLCAIDRAGNISNGATAQANVVALPDISASPSFNNYGNVRVGSTSSIELTISNAGPGDLLISSINLTGNNPDEFNISTGGSQPCESLTPSLLTGQSCTLIVSFNPLSAGLKDATLNINSNDPSYSISLTGTGTYVLNTSIRPSGKGSITGAGISCPEDCSEDYPDPLSTVTLTAIPSEGYYFVRWEGDITGTDNPVTALLENHKNITAVFATSRCVCQTCAYNTIQSAINDALDGDDIRIASGEYSENILINQNKEFILSGGWDDTCSNQTFDPLLTKIDDSGNNSVFTISSDSVNIIASIENLTITNGSAEKGGGINLLASNTGVIDLELSRTVIANNTAQVSGGGINVKADGGTVYIRMMNNILFKNTANAGGGISASSLNNGRINIDIINNTVTENRAVSGGGLYATSGLSNTDILIKNSIVWGNEVEDIYLSKSNTVIAVQYSDIGISINNETSPGIYQEIANIHEDPVFINPALFNYRLNSDSPCRDSGTVDGSLGIDFEGNVRDGQIDIGADEYVDALPNSIKLLSLNGGEVIPSGKPYNITWEAPQTAKSFKVLYSLDNGISWKLIGIVHNLYHLNWNVPSVPNNRKKCRIKIIGFSENDATGVKIGSDISDGPFAIEVIRLNAPNGGETLYSGNSIDITWTTNATKGTVSKVVLSYTKDGGMTWKPIITLSTNDGTYNWTVPNVAATKTKCKVSETFSAYFNLL